MERCWKWLLWGLISTSSALASASELTHIRIAAEDWSEYTQADGVGLAWDIFRLVYEPGGVQLQIESAPYTRSVGLVQRGEADAWAGSYLNEVQDNVSYPRRHYDSDRVAALGLAGMPVPTLENLGSYRLVWLQGYEYQRYLPNLHQYRKVIRRNSILVMLDQARADFYLDSIDDIRGILKTSAEPSRYRVTPLSNLPLYLGFADNARGRTLAKLFDQRMDELVVDGSLKPIFKRWRQPYPFD